MFSLYKRSGIVTDGNALSLINLGGVTFVCVSTFDCFSLLRLDNLAVVLKSRLIPGSHTIQSALAFGYETLVAADTYIYVYNKTRIVRAYNIGAAIVTVISIGCVALVLDEKQRITIIDTQRREVSHRIELFQESECVVMIHPQSYVNKILLGFSNSELQLWNFNSRKLIHVYKGYSKLLPSRPSVSSLVQSPDCDIVAVGFASGDIIFLDLKCDVVLLKCFQQEGRVSSLSFRRDSHSGGKPVFLTGTGSGKINVWCVDESSRSGHATVMLKDSFVAHKSTVSSVHCMEAEPIFITNSDDNSIKVWIFDSTSDAPKLLRKLSGHSGAPLRMNFADSYAHSTKGGASGPAETEVYLACSDGSLMLANLIMEAKDRTFGVKALQKIDKGNSGLSPVIDFDFADSTADSGWATLATIHKGQIAAHIWSRKNKAITSKTLTPPAYVSGLNQEQIMLAPASAVAVTACGNFCVVGYGNGVIHKFNLQSGTHRGHFAHSAVDVAASAARSNSRSITGLFVDLSRRILVSCSSDRLLTFWDFASGKVMSLTVAEHPLLLLKGCKDTGFIAVADNKYNLDVFNIYTYERLRRFKNGHSRRVSDIAFSSDRRMLFTASIDTTVRIWDIVSGRCLQWLSFGSAVTTMALSPTNEYLCIGLFGKVGVYTYLNRSMYQHVFTDFEPSVPTDMSQMLPPDESQTGLKQAQTTILPRNPPLALDKSALISLSLLPRIYKTKLFFSELLRKRTDVAKDLSDLKSSIPFFLSTLAGLQPDGKRLKIDKAPSSSVATIFDTGEDIAK